MSEFIEKVFVCDIEPDRRDGDSIVGNGVGVTSRLLRGIDPLACEPVVGTSPRVGASLYSIAVSDSALTRYGDSVYLVQ
jgi:hypothetical protein